MVFGGWTYTSIIVSYVSVLFISVIIESPEESGPLLRILAIRSLILSLYINLMIRPILIIDLLISQLRFDSFNEADYFICHNATTKLIIRYPQIFTKLLWRYEIKVLFNIENAIFK